MKKTLLIDGKEISYELVKNSGRDLVIKLNGNEIAFNLLSKKNNKIIFENNHELYEGFVESQFDGEQKQIFIYDQEALVDDKNRLRNKNSDAHASGGVQSPMPGKIFKIIKKEGEEVSEGEAVLIMEAMKMEHTIYAASSGVISKMPFKEGDQVQAKTKLFEIAHV